MAALRTIATLLTIGLGSAAFATDVTLVNVYDAFGKPGKATKHFGFSTVVRYGDTVILFDAGADADVFAANLKALEIDPREIDVAVASHGHADHTSGFDHLLEVNPDVRLYLPSTFALGAPVRLNLAGTDPAAANDLPPEHRYFDGDYDDRPIETSGRFHGANVTFVDEPREIAPGVYLVPTRSELMGSFSRYPPNGDDPALGGMPELSLALATAEGDVLVVGCSHASVEAIVTAAREQRQQPIRLLAGGYHLLPYDAPAIAGLTGRLKDRYGVAQVAPAHCTGHLGFKLLREGYGEDYRFFGLGEVLELSTPPAPER